MQSSQLFSPMELPHYKAGKGDQGPSILSMPHSRQTLCSMSGVWLKDVRYHLLTTVTQNLALEIGSWGLDKKKWSPASHEKKTLWLEDRREGALCSWLQQSGVELPSSPCWAGKRKEGAAFFEIPQTLTFLIEFLQIFLNRCLFICCSPLGQFPEI